MSLLREAHQASFRATRRLDLAATEPEGAIRDALLAASLRDLAEAQRIIVEHQETTKEATS